jgi:hypothetical protein
MSRAARCGPECFGGDTGLRVFGKARAASVCQRGAQASRRLRRHHQFAPILALGGQVAHKLIDEIYWDSAAPNSITGSISAPPRS